MGFSGWIALFMLGLRHGVDVDHVAAIADITGLERTRRRAIMLSGLYSAGHAVVVYGLGTLAILTGGLLSEAASAMLGRVVGLSLILLGAYTALSMVRYGPAFVPRSRFMLVVDLVGRMRRALPGRKEELVEIEHVHDHNHDQDHAHEHDDEGHFLGRTDAVFSPPKTSDVKGALLTHHGHRHAHRHLVPMPPDPSLPYGKVATVVLGVVHGIGAETPTQILAFASVSRAGAGVGDGLLMMPFIVGLMASNLAIAACCAFSFFGGRRGSFFKAAMVGITAALSIVVGVMLLIQP